MIRLLLFSLLIAGSGCASAGNSPAAPPPNIILIVCDNLGYGDVGCYGSTAHRTPNLDRLAREGMKFTDFYVSSGVCTPSRASIMTGCYAQRIGLHWNPEDGQVLRPVSRTGLHPDEVTIAEVLKERGYATGMIGKWHLGDQPPFLPTRQGFDFWLGIPYSDDMTARPGKNWPPLPLLRNEKVVEAPVDRNRLTRRYTEEAVRFIREHRRRPFFLYLPHAMPGSTRNPFASEAFRGRSANGPWGDSVEELDWSTGEILKTVKELGLDGRTLLAWTSDNGAPPFRPPVGSNLPLKGWGYTTAEGGMRVPFLVRWPGRIPAGTVCREVATTLDLLPTFARLAGGREPQDRIVDGKDIRPLLEGRPGATSPHEFFFYYHLDQLQAVRSGKWKLYLRLARKQGRGRTQERALYDLRADLAETNDVEDRHPDVVRQLLAAADRARADLGDLERAGRNSRPAGRVEHPTPRILKSR